MHPRTIRPDVTWYGAIDWDRRLFDSLIPLPDGTSYNAYLIRGRNRTVLVDTVDTPMTEVLLQQLADVPTVDFVVCNHAEPDHAGAIPAVLERYPAAEVLCTAKCKTMLVAGLHIAPDRIRTVEDDEQLDLGDRTLRFLHMPWVHWPETMVTYLPEERILFSCDFFGSHIATTDLYVTDEGRVYEAAKRYYGEIMAPFRTHIAKHLERLADVPVDLIAPSHGPVYDRPAFILDAYRDWAMSEPRNLCVIPFVSMHGSTRRAVERLTQSLVDRGVAVERFDLSVTDIGKLAIALVDAGSVVVATPTVLGGPHPLAAYATVLANALRPKARYLSVITSYGWGGKAVETLAGLASALKVEIREPVAIHGRPRQGDEENLDALAEKIAAAHREAGFADRQ